MTSKKLETKSLTIYDWFEYLKSNSEKSQVLLTTDDKLKFKVGNSLIFTKTTVKQLGTTIENKISFESYLNTVYKKS